MVKLGPTGDRLSHSTCIGGVTGVDGGNGLAVHPTGDAYVVGYTESTDFDVVGAIEGDNAGPLADAFITKLVFTSAPPVLSPTPTPTPSPSPSPSATASPSGTAPPSGDRSRRRAPHRLAAPRRRAGPLPRRARGRPHPRRRRTSAGRRGARASAATVASGSRSAQAAGATGTAAFVAGRLELARTAFTVPAGGRVALRPRLSRKHLKRLRRSGRLSVQARVTLRGRRGAVTRSLTLTS